MNDVDGTGWWALASTFIVAASIPMFAASCHRSPTSPDTLNLVGLVSTSCLAPLAIPDKWIENSGGPWTPGSTFERYEVSGSTRGGLLANPDVYDSRAGFAPADDGTRLTLTNQSGSRPLAGAFIAVDVPRSNPPTDSRSALVANISGCNGVLISVGGALSPAIGNNIGPLAAATAALIARDPAATWDEATHSIRNSCAPVCAATSPRLLNLPIYDPDAFQHAIATTADAPALRIVKILPYFLASAAVGSLDGFLIVTPR